MRKMRVAVTGLLCFVAHGAHSQSFEQQINQRVSGAALQTRQAMAASQAATAQGCGEGCGAGAVNPADALDETKAGVAAKFVSIKPGEFEMGSPKDEAGRWEDEIQHTVKLTKGYEMQATAVTQLQYFLVMGRNPSAFRKQENCDQGNFKFKVMYGLGLCVNHPVEHVSWDDAQAFIAQLNKTQSKYTYRLPTEAEWENAARAGTPSDFPYSFGFNDTNELTNYAWYDENMNGRTHAVATKKANQCGLYDMNGNVWQWVNDYYGDYPTATVQEDPAGPTTGSNRVFRGGSWFSVAGALRSANRGFGVPDGHDSRLGFRLVRSSRGPLDPAPGANEN